MLVAAFAVSFAAVVAATTALVAFFVYVYSSGATPLGSGADFGDWALEHRGLLGIVALGTLGLLVAASAYRAASLAGGGGRVARMLGGTEVPGDATDLARKRLVNVVEEMAIASGLPRPDVYVLEHEAGINAFAAGRTPADAAVAVTRGALERLDRAELQGVIAHELSHIVNGDIRLNQQLIGFSFGILVLSLVGRWMLRGARVGRRGRRSRGTGAAVVLGTGFVAIGSIGLLASRLIKAAVSRERERLADASAVQFTRAPAGLASALKKIAGIGGALTAVESEEVAHMLFEHRGAAFRGWFATHPPLVERIRALDPSFDPRTLRALERAAATQPDAADDAETAVAALSVPGTRHAPASATLTAHSAAPLHAPHDAADASSPLERAGQIGEPALGAALRAALPAEIYDAAHSRDASLLLVLALVLVPDARTRHAQASLLDAQLGRRRAERCAALAEALDRVDPALYIPILELAVPALKQRPAEQLDYLFDLTRKLGECGGERRLFDYVLMRMLAAYVAPDADRFAASAAAARTSPRDAAAALLAVVAAYGHDDAESALAAYRAGRAALGGDARREPAPSLDAMRDLDRLDAALARLARLAPRAKRRVLEAVLATIRHDRRIGTEELELFRAIAATLGCPLPWDIGLRKRWREGALDGRTAAPVARAAD
ncbi:MAG TPA: M48 family metallopeptidase [Gammaproteobacteria bacterium]